MMRAFRMWLYSLSFNQQNIHLCWDPSSRASFICVQPSSWSSYTKTSGILPTLPLHNSVHTCLVYMIGVNNAISLHPMYDVYDRYVQFYFLHPISVLTGNTVVLSSGGLSVLKCLLAPAYQTVVKQLSSKREKRFVHTHWLQKGLTH
jgi:hypothetical protein